MFRLAISWRLRLWCGVSPIRSRPKIRIRRRIQFSLDYESGTTRNRFRKHPFKTGKLGAISRKAGTLERRAGGLI